MLDNKHLTNAKNILAIDAEPEGPIDPQHATQLVIAEALCALVEEVGSINQRLSELTQVVEIEINKLSKRRQ